MTATNWKRWLSACYRRAVVRGRKRDMHVGFAERLKRARIAAGLTPIELGRLAALSSPTSAYALEAGANIPRINTAEKLSRALRLAPSLLAFGVDGIWDPAAGPLWEGLGGRLREAREARGLSLREVGRISATSATLVRMTEAGRAPTLAMVEKIAKPLQLSPAWLAYGIEPRELQRRGAARAAAAETTSA